MFATKPLIALSAVALLSSGFVGSALAGTTVVDEKDSKKQVIKQKDTSPKFYFSLGVGTDVDLKATPFSEEARGVAFLPASSTFSGGTNRVGALRVERRRYDAVYPYDIGNGPYRAQAEFGYVASRYGEIFGMLKYTHQGADSFRIGTAAFGDEFDAAGNFTGRRGFKVPVFAEFDDYNSIGVELGFRLFMLPKESRIRPYVSFAAGATYVDDIDARFFLSDGTTLYRGGFYQGGVVATGALMTGVEFALTKNLSFGAETGLRYEFPLSQRDRDLGNVGLGGAIGTTNNTNLTDPNNAGDRFYLPFTVYGKFRF